MLERLQTKRDAAKAKGFTIIEVMIVLAIAGLIIAVVLVAIPQLQRNQRNQARRDIANRIAAEISNFSGNNNGAIPTAAEYTGVFWTRYITSGGASFNDPSSGSTVAPSAAAALPNPPVQGTVYYAPSTLCQGEARVASTSARNFTIIIGLEGGAAFCADNG